MNKREYDRQEELDYVLDDDGNKHRIYPMKIKDKDRVFKLFENINDEYPLLNFPSEELDDNGNIVKDDNGNPVINDNSYIAMLELLEIALHEPAEKFTEWLDIVQVSTILYAFRGISGLKKKIQEMNKERLQIGKQLELDLLPILP